MNRFFRTLFLVVIFSLPGLVSAEEEYWEYTLRPGDSIWSIAKRFTTSVNNWAELEKLNQARQGSSQKLLAGTRIVIPVSMLKLQPSPALVIAIKGGAKLTRANGESAEVTTDTKLHSGDKIVTADGQSLRLQFADKSELQVLPNSEVILDKLSHHKDSGMVDTRIRLNSGSVDTWVGQAKSIWRCLAGAQTRWSTGHFRRCRYRTAAGRSSAGSGAVIRLCRWRRYDR